MLAKDVHKALHGKHAEDAFPSLVNETSNTDGAKCLVEGSECAVGASRQMKSTFGCKLGALGPAQCGDLMHHPRD